MQNFDIDTKAESIVTHAANELFSLGMEASAAAELFGFYAVTMMIDNEGSDAAAEMLEELKKNIDDIAPLLNK